VIELEPRLTTSEEDARLAQPVIDPVLVVLGTAPDDDVRRLD
jgi:hypothetical protein